ncbi:MAG: substrate-binding domain-containing protein [Sphaerochaetaceae bacterium]|nr:substrate-binding domain-containing protein [Sphaerochaetaceae bacterium]MDD3366446.1 substrate-binding domain-containing protein [Sphaerochaetaceae bacterium]MDD4220238.1 substrate-binding domain-containing protein [Sphaerochaetaceae bacterium]MDY0371304.1 substrate-binding domain-containing protein [Sphaerochaetaceae bacterium]
MKKKWMMALVILILGTMVFAAGAQETGPKKIVIGTTVYTTQHEFYADVISGMKAVAEREGVELIVTDANSSVTTQNNQIEDFQMQKVDAIITYGVDPMAIVASVEAAIDAGIPVITCDMKLVSDKVATFIGSDNYMLGSQAGEFAVEYINKNYGGKANIGVVSWLASVAQQERLKGFQDVVNKNSNAKFVAVQEGDGRSQAMASAENIMQANPNLNMFYGTNEGSTIGILSAVESAGKLNDIAIVGIDISNDAARAIKEGTLIATIAQQPVLLGEYAVEAALKAIAGEKLDERIVVPVKTVTKDNVDDFLK